MTPYPNFLIPLGRSKMVEIFSLAVGAMPSFTSLSLWNRLTVLLMSEELGMTVCTCWMGGEGRGREGESGERGRMKRGGEREGERAIGRGEGVRGRRRDEEEEGGRGGRREGGDRRERGGEEGE